VIPSSTLAIKYNHSVVPDPIHRFGSVATAIATPVAQVTHEELPWLFKAIAKLTKPLWNGQHSLLDRLDRDKIFELAVTDIGGMVFPRALIEGLVRNFDMARETFLREIDGTFNLLVLPSFLNKAAISVFNRMPLLNPKRLFMGAYAQGEALSQMGRHAEALLTSTTHNTPAQLREGFINAILEHISIKDQAFMGRFTQQANAGIKASNVLDAPLQNHVFGFKHTLDGQAIATMPAEELEKLKPLAQWLQHHPNPLKGMVNIDEAVAHHWDSLSPLAKAKTSKANVRLQISRDLQPSRRLIHDTIQQFLVERGFSNGVLLHPPQDSASEGVKPVALSLKEFIMGMDSFLQQYLDPLLAHPHTGQLAGNTLTADDKLAILHRLAGNPSSPKPGFWGRFLPQKNDGLIAYAHKAQTYLTALPLVATFVAAYSFPKLNNAFTRTIHGGKNFFPGAQRGEDQLPVTEASSSSGASGNKPASVATQLKSGAGGYGPRNLGDSTMQVWGVPVPVPSAPSVAPTVLPTSKADSVAFSAFSQ
jgi:hypothetical protein